MRLYWQQDEDGSWFTEEPLDKEHAIFAQVLWTRGNWSVRCAVHRLDDDGGSEVYACNDNFSPANGDAAKSFAADLAGALCRVWQFHRLTTHS